MANLLNSIIGGQRVGRGNFAHISNLSLGYCSFISTSGAYHNTALGVNTLRNLTSGDANTAVGYKALCSVNTGIRNTGIGYLAGCTITTGANNTFIGFCTTPANGTCSNNTAIGICAQRSLIGNNNTSIGFCAHTKSSGTNTVSNNTAIGYKAGAFTYGSNNISIGSCSFVYHNNVVMAGSYRYSSGGESVAVGHGSGYSVGTGAIAVGVNAFALGNFSVAIGRYSQVTSNYHMKWGNSGNNTRNCIWPEWTLMSDQRDKANIQSLNEKYGIEFIKKLKPKSFCWDNRETYVRECGFEFGTKDGTLTHPEENYGFIAQDVKETLNELGIKFDALGGEENDAYRLEYGAFIAPMIKTIQEISNRLDMLDTEVTQLETV